MSLIDQRMERAFRSPFAFPQFRAVSPSHFHRLVLIIAGMVYATTAWFSTGYHSADEHFQLIAFAQWKLGELPMEHLAWEFSAGIRSSLQPWIAVIMFKCAAFFHVTDPFTRTLLLRLLTAALTLYAMRGFVNATSTNYGERLHRAYILLAYGLWFLPFLAVRFSSEGWSAILLLLLLTTVLRATDDRHWAWKAGILAGLAIGCRPSTGLIIISLLVWLHWHRRERLRSLGLLGSTLGLTLLLGFMLDSLFYGSTVFTLWKYIGLGFGSDPAVRFDTLPWWYYPPWIIKYAIPPIGALILLALAVLIVRSPKHILVWIMLPFLVAHSILPHKELRFLYPLAPLVPWLLIEARSTLVVWKAPIPKAICTIVVAIVVVANTLGLIVVVGTPAGEGRVRLAQALRGASAPGDRIGYVVDAPTAWRITLPGFYQPTGTEEVILGTDPGINTEVRYLMAPSDAVLHAPPDRTLVPLVRSQPAWSDLLMRWYTWHEGRGPWTLYRMERSTR